MESSHVNKLAHFEQNLADFRNFIVVSLARMAVTIGASFFIKYSQVII